MALYRPWKRCPVVRIPVIAVGKLSIPEVAEKIIAEGQADIVALGKGLLADAFWVKKVEEGKPERIRPCIGCHDGCMGRVMKGKPLSCAVNPATGRESSYRLVRAERPKKVAVVGGGPAGLEAARVAALRGHEVILVEILKDLLIGGLPVQHMNRLMLLDLLKFHKVEVLTHTSLLEVLEDGALLIDHELRRRYSSADGIVVAVGLKPERGLYQALRNQNPNLYGIGDCRNPQNVMNAVWDAYEIGRMI